MRKFHTIFHSGFTSLHFYHRCSRVPFSPQPHQHLLILVFFYNSHLTGIKGSHCGLNLHFPGDLWYWATFHIHVDLGKMFSKVCVLWKNVFSEPLPIFFLIVCFFAVQLCEFFLYILDISPLSDIWFTNIFSHSVGCLFLLLISFVVQKPFSLI